MNENDILRFDAYNKQAVEMSKTAIAAVVLINSGAWLALLTQVSKLLEAGYSRAMTGPMVLWASGASVGVSLWGIGYIIARLIVGHLNQPHRVSLARIASVLSWLGVVMFFMSLVFSSGVHSPLQGLLHGK